MSGTLATSGTEADIGDYFVYDCLRHTDLNQPFFDSQITVRFLDEALSQDYAHGNLRAQI